MIDFNEILIEYSFLRGGGILMGDKSKITIFLCVALLFLFIIFGCGKDTNGPTIPESQLKDQVFSIAVGNGDNTLHTGATRVLLDWNNDSTETNIQKLPVIYVSEDLPVIDGKGDDTAWQEVDWTPINLQLIEDGVNQDAPKTSGTPITKINMKAVFNTISMKVCFLLQWTDTDVNDQHEPHYRKNVWTFFKDREDTPWYHWIYDVDSDSDWVAFMFDTWKWHLNSKGEKDDLKPMSKDFQEKGCDTNCHNTDRPYHVNEDMPDPYDSTKTVSEITDLWVWDATFTNFAGESEDPETPNPPGYIHDGFIDSKAGIYGDRNDITVRDPDLRPAIDKAFFDFQSDEGTPGYQKNTFTGNKGEIYRPGFISEEYFFPTNEEPNNPWARPPYIWLPKAFDYGTYQGQFNWVNGVSIISGFVNRNALGGGADVSCLGIFDPKTNTWTLEIGRALEAKSDQDVDFFIFNPHDYTP